MIPGFHVGALLLHDQIEAIANVAEMGYRCVALRPRVGQLDPNDARFGEQVLRAAEMLRRTDMSCVLDIESFFLHDRQSVRGPALASADRKEADLAEAMIDRWIDLAAEIGAETITFSSGAVGSSLGDEAVLEMLSARLDTLTEKSSQKDVRLALHPRSGDAVATVAQFERLRQWLGDPERLGLAADIVEMLLGHEFPIGDRLERNMETLVCVYLADHRAGITGDQRIGHGDVAVSRIVSSLAAQEFQGPAIVRVDRHSELGFETAAESIKLFDRK